jgi:hypothetical protein
MTKSDRVVGIQASVRPQASNAPLDAQRTERTSEKPFSIARTRAIFVCTGSMPRQSEDGTTASSAPRSPCSRAIRGKS